MRMINELVVRGAPSEIAKFVGRLENIPQTSWKRELEIEERLKDMGAAPSGAFAFSSEGDAGRPPASLILHRRGSAELFVSNIFAKGRRSLSDEEYNDMLSEFERDVVEPNARGIGIETIMIPPFDRLESSLSPEALRRLKAFSNDANRSALHPRDWRRWDQFLIQIHQDGSSADDFELALWLGNHGWTENQFGRFIERFRAGQSLLATYDEERSAS